MPTEDWKTAAPTVPFDEATARLSPKQSELVERLARRLITMRPMRWSSLGSFAKRGLDRVDVETTVLALFRAGWIELRHRKGPAGDPTPTQLRISEAAVDAASSLVGAQSPSQRKQTLDKLIGGLEEHRAAAAAPVPERVLVRRVFGQTKAVRIREYRSELESHLGVRLEDLVRFHVDIVLTAGPVRYRYRGVQVDLRGSEPWAAITEPVAAELTDVDLDGVEEVVCVENQTPFEHLIYQGMAKRTVLVFTSGYLGTVERDWMKKLIGAGIRRIRHWGDLDPWGLDIYRDLASFVGRVDAGVHAEPWRMDPSPLQRPDTQKLTTEDWIALHRYLKRNDAPLRETADALKRLGVKLEQEALLDGNQALDSC